MSPTTSKAALLDDVRAFVRRFVILLDAQADAVALWVVHTHALKAAEATPYLSITSAVRESGKTRLLETLALIVARPWLTGRTTTAALTRKISTQQPTLLLDESDTAFNGDKDYAEALRGVLNTGYRPSGSATVCVANGAGRFTFEDLATFCPKAIAGIGSLPDTVASRSIPIRLKRRAAGEMVDRFRQRRVEEAAAPIVERLEVWATDPVVEQLAALEPDVPDELADRAADVWEPLLAIAELASGDWPTRARAAARELSANSSPTDDDPVGLRLLADCRRAFDADGAEKLLTADLLARLNSDDEAVWSTFRRGQPLDPVGLAKRLRTFEVRSERSSIYCGGRTGKGYLRTSFEDAWRRYLPPVASGPSDPRIHADSGHSLTRQNRVGLTDSERGRIADGQTDLTDLTASTGETGILNEVDELVREGVLRGVA